MNYKCPVCAHALEPYGDSGMTCVEGHQFLVPDAQREQSVALPVPLRKKPFHLPAWVPGAVLGGLALAISLAEYLA